MAERREQARRTLLAVAAVLPALLFPLGWWIWLGVTALAGL